MNSNMEIPAELISSPRKGDLIAMIAARRKDSEEIPSIITSEPPEIIFSAPNFHGLEDSCTNDSDTEEEPQNKEIIERSPFLNRIMQSPRYNLLPMKTRKAKRLTLVLDLDETLVHSELSPIENPDTVLKVSFNGEICSVYVRFRPGMFEFLNKVSKKFDLVAFTASHEAYASQLLNVIDPQRKMIRYRFYRSSCVEIKGNLIKDLRLFGRSLSEVIIVDNTISAFSFQLENGIPITSWFSDPNDIELYQVSDFLDSLLEVPDVRPVLKAAFNISAQFM
ncbi:unnamed protein product [Blepharisma stoltei]|uniref:FCP1 homology domain-containing protein n=1 Tax=Blepharisma stoltei TaxID=1481888 RepID=A0AAU9J7W8_9CILI|nr:unnamed protein product [Blepharisma stoltei]